MVMYISVNNKVCLQSTALTCTTTYQQLRLQYSSILSAFTSSFYSAFTPSFIIFSTYMYEFDCLSSNVFGVKSKKFLLGITSNNLTLPKVNCSKSLIFTTKYYNFLWICMTLDKADMKCSFQKTIRLIHTYMYSTGRWISTQSHTHSAHI